MASVPTRQNWWTPAAPEMIGAVVHVYVPRQHRVVGHDHVVAQVAVVGDVRADHQQAVVADDGRVIGNQRPMDGHVLADGVVLSR